MNANQVRARLKAEARKLGSQKALAKKIGVSPAFLCDMIRGGRNPSGKPVAFLGLVRKVSYVKANR